MCVSPPCPGTPAGRARRVSPALCPAAAGPGSAHPRCPTGKLPVTRPGAPRRCLPGPAGSPLRLSPRPPPALLCPPSPSLRSRRVQAGHTMLPTHPSFPPPTGDPERPGGRARRCKASICPEAPSSRTCRWFSFIFFPPPKERKGGGGGERKSEPTRQPPSLAKVPLCWKKGQMCLLFAH